MALWKEVQQFIAALLQHSGWFVTTGVVESIIAVVQKYKPRFKIKLSFSAYISIFLLSVLVAAFFAWSDLRSQLDNKQKLDSILSKLGEFRGYAQSLEQKCWKGDPTVPGLFETFNQQTHDYLRKHGDPQDASQLDDLSTIDVPRNLPNTCTWLSIQQKHLNTLIRKYEARVTAILSRKD